MSQFSIWEKNQVLKAPFSAWAKTISQEQEEPPVPITAPWAVAVVTSQRTDDSNHLQGGPLEADNEQCFLMCYC